MKKLFLASLMVILVVGLILGGCAKKTTSTTTTTTQTQTSTSTTVTTPHKVLKIGAVIGLETPTGVEQKKWLELFAKLINDQGGWKIGNDTYDVDMIIYDSQDNPDQGKSYLEKLVLQDGVKFVLGSPTSNPATDAEVTEPNKVIDLGYDVTGTSADPKFQYYYTPRGYLFFSGYYYVIDKAAAAEGAKSYVSAKPDNMYGRITDGWGNAAWAATAPDVKYLGTVFFDQSTADWGPVATKLMSLHPDVIDCVFNIPNSGLYNALYDAGYKGIIFPNIDAGTLAAIVTHCGNAFVEGWKFSFSDPRLYPNQDPAMSALMDAYIKEYGTWEPDGCEWVIPWFVLEDAINATQSVDVDVIKAYLDKTDHAVKTMTGYSQLVARPDANNLRTVSGIFSNLMGIVKDGKLVPLSPVTIKDDLLATILSNGWVDVYKAYWEQYGYPTFPADETSTIKFSDLGITGHD